jgi:hypothetical protein
MDMRCRHFVTLGLALMTSSASFSAGLTSASKYDPAATGRPSHPPQSFLDFTLQRINPAGTDYGQCIDESRKLLLSETIDDRYFWSSVVGSGVLVFFFVLIVFQEKRYRRAEWRTGEALAQYEHALALARGEFAEASNRNQDLMKTLSRVPETGANQRALTSEAPARPTAATPSRVSTANKKPAGTPASGNSDKAGEARTDSVKTGPGDSQIRLFNPDGDLVMKINSQEQQIGSLREQVNLLRRQLTESDRRLRAEQEKNRNLKGA